MVYVFLFKSFMVSGLSSCSRFSVFCFVFLVLYCLKFDGFGFRFVYKGLVFMVYGFMVSGLGLWSRFMVYGFMVQSFMVSGFGL